MVHGKTIVPELWYNHVNNYITMVPHSS